MDNRTLDAHLDVHPMPISHGNSMQPSPRTIGSQLSTRFRRASGQRVPWENYDGAVERPLSIGGGGVRIKRIKRIKSPPPPAVLGLGL